MRIISGEWRGRNLVAPKGEATRPTADRTRETLFSMLVSRLGSFDDLAILDLFAGSGALGLEALSRGAAHALLVERDRDACEAIRQNIRALGSQSRAELRESSVLSLGQATRAYDVVFADPPYGTGAGSVALHKLSRQGWIAPSAWVAVETGRGEVVSVEGFTVESERPVGKAQLTLLRPTD